MVSTRFRIEKKMQSTSPNRVFCYLPTLALHHYSLMLHHTSGANYDMSSALYCNHFDQWFVTKKREPFDLTTILFEQRIVISLEKKICVKLSGLNIIPLIYHLPIKSIFISVAVHFDATSRPFYEFEKILTICKFIGLHSIMSQVRGLCFT